VVTSQQQCWRPPATNEIRCLTTILWGLSAAVCSELAALAVMFTCVLPSSAEQADAAREARRAAAAQLQELEARAAAEKTNLDRWAVVATRDDAACW